MNSNKYDKPKDFLFPSWTSKFPGRGLQAASLLEGQTTSAFSTSHTLLTRKRRERRAPTSSRNQRAGFDRAIILMDDVFNSGLPPSDRVERGEFNA
jgi:hypothetical protein